MNIETKRTKETKRQKERTNKQTANYLQTREKITYTKRTELFTHKDYLQVETIYTDASPSQSTNFMTRNSV